MFNGERLNGGMMPLSQAGPGAPSRVASLLHQRRPRRHGRAGRRARWPGAGRAAGDPVRPDRGRAGPAGRDLRALRGRSRSLAARRARRAPDYPRIGEHRDHPRGADPARRRRRVERLLAELNPAQREAVTHGEGPLLVLAGAGSGKTRVLTHRIAWLLATGRARPSEILAITFTNKAANEMRERVASLVGGVSRAMWVMTFHSACARILRADADAARLQARVHDLRRGRLAADGQALHGGARARPEALSRRARSRRRSRAPRTSSSTPPTTPPRPAPPFEEAVADVYDLYERRMVEASAMDFDDLLVRTVNLLELFADVREKYRRIFRWVLVDEYQDTNRAQYRLLQLLTEEHRNLTVVGDDFQAVYSVPRRRHPQHPRVRARLPRRRRRCCSSRTTARPRRSSTPPTR